MQDNQEQKKTSLKEIVFNNAGKIDFRRKETG